MTFQHVSRYSRKSLRVLGSVGEPINPSAWRCQLYIWIFCLSIFPWISEHPRHAFFKFLFIFEQVVFQCGRWCKVPHIWHMVANRNRWLHGISVTAFIIFIIHIKMNVLLQSLLFLSRLLLYQEHGRRNLVLLLFLSLESRYLLRIITDLQVYLEPSLSFGIVGMILLSLLSSRLCDGVSRAMQYRLLECLNIFRI